MIDFMFATPKRHILGRNGVFCVKIRPGPLAVASCKNPPKKQKTNTFWCAKSRMHGNETSGRVVTNCCTGAGVHESPVPICITIAYGVWAWRGVKFWASPLICVVALTTLSHYRAIAWFHDILTFTHDFDAFQTQKTAQHLYFSSQFTNEFGIRIFIDDCLADDLLRTIRVPNSTTPDQLRQYWKKQGWC